MLFNAYKDECDWLACGAMTNLGRGGGGGGGEGKFAVSRNTAIKIVTRIIKLGTFASNPLSFKLSLNDV